jgi:hypothetical protein
MLAKTMDRYVLPILAQCDTATMAFNLRMSWTNFDTFALIVNFLNWEWVPCRVINGLFEAPNTSGVALVEIIKLFFGKVQSMWASPSLSKLVTSMDKIWVLLKVNNWYWERSKFLHLPFLCKTCVIGRHVQFHPFVILWPETSC